MVVLERPAIRPEPLSENARTTFGSASAPAWCLRLLHDANLTPVATPSRQPKASSEDSFIAETLATGDTISAWQSFYKVPQPQPRPSPATTGANSPVAGELVSLLALLGRGVNGHTNVAHGGLVATILDDTMGMVEASAYPQHCPLPHMAGEQAGGRKLWLRGTVEDGEGGLFAEAEGLWIEVQEKEPKL
ncbi:thioesterase family protein [Metarhizium acridum CQMa 102]|uniref:Thioesterase family protein n=1 Tax=Metarhizium acridum (strain CQMa 102) TaxID=655827 RepID=E9EHU7_METAQ|nr:thioesterase family protein [Metarhizium acridum CQMa 102]EFY84500.1 thioesterase family protein [Metarhizium acridum CQMa 102]